MFKIVSYTQIAYLSLFFIICCSVESGEYEQRVSSLSTYDLKREFLDSLFKSDQELRKGQDSEIALEFGYRSKEHNEFLDKQNARDSKNLKLIEMYLSIYEYPSKANLGEIASYTPFTVIHHSNDLKSRRVNFKYLYSAYKNSDLDGSDMLMFLNRMHRMQFGGENFVLKNKTSDQHHINLLIEKLNLEKYID